MLNIKFIFFSFFIFTVSVIVFSGCGFHKNSDTVNIPSKNIPSKEQEHNTTVFILTNYGHNESREIYVLLNTILKRLKSGVEAANINFSNETIPGKFYVLESNSKGAFSQCNGTIYLTKGLIKSIQSLAELSVIIAHELSHIANRDACTLKEEGDTDFISFDLDKEIEADRIATKILAGSFIDPGYFFNALKIQYSELSPSSKEFSDLQKRITILRTNIEKIPKIHTKFPEERQFIKIKEQL